MLQTLTIASVRPVAVGRDASQGRFECIRSTDGFSSFAEVIRNPRKPQQDARFSFSGVHQISGMGDMDVSQSLLWPAIRALRLSGCAAMRP